MTNFRFLSFLQYILILALFLFGNLHASVQIFKGKEIEPHIDEITQICLTVYREYPHFYEGTEEEYRPIIERYVKSKESIAALAFSDRKLVGVAIGAPFQDTPLHYQAPVGIRETSSSFYLAEFLVLKEYRGHGFGRKLFENFQNEAFKTHAEIVLYAIDCQSLASLWQKFGFKEEPLVFYANWLDCNTQELILHKLIFWSKSHH